MIARQDLLKPSTHVMGVDRFERLFRTAAGLHVDKEDLKRHSELVNQRITNLLIRAVAAAKANGRDIIQPFDLPITKGLQECIHEFKSMDLEIELQPILDRLTSRPPLELAYSAETEQRLPSLAGGISLALARSFKIIDPEMKNPRSEHWERAFALFNLLL